MVFRLPSGRAMGRPACISQHTATFPHPIAFGQPTCLVLSGCSLSPLLLNCNTRIEVRESVVEGMQHTLDIAFEDMNGDLTTLRELGAPSTEHWVVVNVASACGFTRQYAGLQTLSLQEGVTVVGFPCNQFGAQEPGTHEEICAFTADTFDVDFPLMAKTDVKGENVTPLFAHLSSFSNASGKGGDIRWNFEKFLINVKGEVTRFSSGTEPEELL